MSVLKFDQEYFKQSKNNRNIMENKTEANLDNIEKQKMDKSYFYKSSNSDYGSRASEHKINLQTHHPKNSKFSKVF